MKRAARSTNHYIMDAMVLLRSKPRTKLEISIALDVTQRAVDRTVNALAERRLIEPVGLSTRHGEHGTWAVLYGWAK